MHDYAMIRNLQQQIAGLNSSNWDLEQEKLKLQKCLLDVEDAILEVNINEANFENYLNAENNALCELTSTHAHRHIQSYRDNFSGNYVGFCYHRDEAGYAFINMRKTLSDAQDKINGRIKELQGNIVENQRSISSLNSKIYQLSRSN